uniref:Splicing factor 3A subunit 1 n=1 Tax=Panagrolaimus superbus TaxID=310955 RepID=A0A914YRS9_9BILA
MVATNGTAVVQRVSNREEDSMNLEPSLSGKEIIGIIYPPPDIRTIVDKTAAFVAKHGVEFENKIKEKEALNPKFSFLSPTDPYHAYYKHKVKEGENNESNGISAPAVLHGGAQAPEAVVQHIREKEFVPTEPPKNFEFTADPSTINGFDLDVLRLTALFVARNGRQFLTSLMNKEIRNFQFDFLKPQHSNFPYFTKLVEQYSKVILPPQDVDVELSKSSGFDKVMEDVKYRVAWEKHQKAIKDRANEESERERVAYAQIDWHDFVVVQTVDYQPSETSNLPPLCTPKDVGTRILLQQREEQKAAHEDVEMEVESESEEEETSEPEENEVNRDADGFAVPKPKQYRAPYQVHQPAPSAEISEDVIVRDYDPRKAKAAAKPKLADQYIISPLTNERIPASKLEEHVRYNTVDPQYKVQRDREMMERVEEDPTNASGTEISRNISKLAERRTDIFGVGEKGIEQTVIGKKLGEEERAAPRMEPKNIWDGQQSTIDATTRAAQQDVTMQQQINDLQKMHGLEATKKDAPMLPPPPPQGQIQGVGRLLNVPLGAPPLMGMPSGFIPPPAPFGMIPGGPPRFIPPPPHVQDAFNQPPAKRARVEDDLIPAGLWMQKVNGDINILASLPNASEWNCTARQEQLPLDITSLVSHLKTVIQDKSGIPASKQKLQYDGMFLKDTNSLAYYNMNNNSVIAVQVKERGGRKK